MNRLALAVLAAAAPLLAACATKVTTSATPNAVLHVSGPRVPLKGCYVPDNYTSMLSGRRFAVAKFIAEAGAVFATEKAYFGTPLDEDCDVKLTVNTMKPQVTAHSARTGRGLFEMKGSFGFDAYPKMHAALVGKFAEPGIVESVLAERAGAAPAPAPVPAPLEVCKTLIKGDVAAAQAMFDRGADVHAKVDGYSLYNCAVQSGRPEGVRLLRARGLPRSAAFANNGWGRVTDHEYAKNARYHSVVAALEEDDAPRAAAAAPAAPPAEPVSDVDAPKPTGAARPDDFALIVGVDEYQSLPKADYGVRDAKAVRAHLEALGVPARNIVSIEGPRATGNRLKSYLEEWLPLNVKPESTLWVYYSGHGAPDPKTGEAYLVPWDGDAQFLRSSALPLKSFYASLGKTKAKRVIVALDACFSGAGGRSVLAQGARPLVSKVADVQAGERITVLAAASGDEITGTLPEQGHGMFTYFLLKGLGEGKKSAKSLVEYLTPKVQDEARRQNREQTPKLIGADAEL